MTPVECLVLQRPGFMSDVLVVCRTSRLWLTFRVIFDMLVLSLVSRCYILFPGVIFKIQGNDFMFKNPVLRLVPQRSGLTSDILGLCWASRLLWMTFVFCLRRPDFIFDTLVSYVRPCFTFEVWPPGNYSKCYAHSAGP